MRYTHGFRVIRKRKHIVKISAIIMGIIMVLAVGLGFRIIDAQMFLSGFTMSLMRVMVAYVIAVVVAVGLGLVVTATEEVEGVVLPVLDALQSFPWFSLLPLLILYLGRTSGVIIVILTVEMIWPILFTVLSAQKQMRQDLIEAATAFGAKGRKFWQYVQMPLLWPAIVTGSIVAWGEAWETIVAAEIIVALPGVGTYLMGTTNTQVVVVGMTILLLLLFLINKYVWLELLNATTKYQHE